MRLKDREFVRFVRCDNCFAFYAESKPHSTRKCRECGSKKIYDSFNERNE